MVLLQVEPGDDLDLHTGLDLLDDAFDLSAIADDETDDLRAVAFAWLGADPAEGQLWWWTTGERNGYAYCDDRAEVHPVDGTAFDVLADRLTGTPPFDDEFEQWDRPRSFSAVTSDSLLD